MIKICSMHEAKGFNGEVIAIVRSLKNPGSMKHMPVLSPDWPLFKHYLSAREAGQWNADAFREWYVPEFLDQIAHDPNAVNTIAALVQQADSTNRCLVCFCTDETLCHRSIIAGILQFYGVDVTGISQDYSKYGKMYREMLK